MAEGTLGETSARAVLTMEGRVLLLASLHVCRRVDVSSAVISTMPSTEKAGYEVRKGKARQAACMYSAQSKQRAHHASYSGEAPGPVRDVLSMRFCVSQVPMWL